MKRKTAKLVCILIPHRKTRHRVRKWLETADIQSLLMTPCRILRILTAVRSHNRVFLVEANPFHIECMYSVYEHFHGQHEKVIILTTNQNIQKCMFADNVKIYCITPAVLSFLDRIKFFNRAKMVFVNSYFIWASQRTADTYFKNYIKTGRPLLAIDHAPNFYDWARPVPKNIHRMVLADFMSAKYGFPTFYAFSFPYTAEITTKDKKFISVGVIGDKSRRDMNSYLDILDKSPDMFSYIISAMIFPEYKQRLAGINNVSVFEQASFDTLFRCCRDSTFIPFLIHDESLPLYMDRITGNINLVLGFGLIPIIDKKLAPLYKINETTGILYNGAKELGDAIKRARLMTVDEIYKMRQNILNLANELRRANAETIDKII